tara:strand:- start:206 stop:658 length:453 start_codon:yes stop_codon:yes gene_type:complete
MLNLLTGLLPIGEKLVERLIPDPAARAKAMQELKSMEQKGELAKLEAQFADKDSARQMQMAAMNSENASWLQRNIVPILACGTTIMIFSLFLILMLIDIPDQSHDLSMILLGGLLSSQSVILSFYFGSSMGSKDKSDDLVSVLKKKEPRV